MKKATLSFSNVNLRASHIHKFRGFIGNLFKEHDLIHNHDEKGTPIYRYPLIQFKLMEGFSRLPHSTKYRGQIIIRYC